MPRLRFALGALGLLVAQGCAEPGVPVCRTCVDGGLDGAALDAARADGGRVDGGPGSCVDTGCGAGERCNPASGRCEDVARCEGVECPAGSECRDGACISLDVDGDGFTPDDGDCDETREDVHPGALEVCNDRDDDCDGDVDDDCCGGPCESVDGDTCEPAPEGSSCGDADRCFGGDCFRACDTGNDGSVTCDTLCSWCRGRCRGAYSRVDPRPLACSHSGERMFCYCDFD